jgi:hypothetical protein
MARRPGPTRAHLPGNRYGVRFEGDESDERRIDTQSVRVARGCDTAPVRSRLAAVSTWAWGLISGLLFGTGMTVWFSLQEGDVPWIVRIVLGVLAGAMFGTAMGVYFRREFGAARDELAALPLGQRRAVLRSAVRGPAPTDPAVRAAALRRVERTRNLLQRRSRFNLIFFTVALVGYALLALWQSPWWWVAFALFAVQLAGQLAMRHRLDRRISVLSTPPTL